MRVKRADDRPNSGIEGASDIEWQVASDRAQILEGLLQYGSGPEKIASAAKELGLAQAMLYRLLALYRLDPSHSSLLPKRAGQSPGTHRLDQNLEALIDCSMRKDLYQTWGRSPYGCGGRSPVRTS